MNGPRLFWPDAKSRDFIETSPSHPNSASPELAGKIETNRNQGDKLRAQMVQVEAVIKMLAPDFSVAGIAAKRRNKSNPWFKRGTLFRSAVEVLRRATAPMTARQIADVLIAGKAPQATRKQAIDLQAAILVSLRKRNGGTVIGEGAPAQWRLKN